MKKILPFIIILISFSKVFCCTCQELNKANTQEMYKKADFVVIGKAFTNIRFEPTQQKLANERKSGFDVLIKVDSVLKGDLAKGDTIFIFQYGGSCTRDFSFEEAFIIFGDQISRFKHKQVKSVGKDGELLPLPPPTQIENHELEMDSRRKQIRFYNKQVKKYSTMTTSLCETLFVREDNLKLLEK